MTGAAGGVGAPLCAALAGRGYTVYAGVRSDAPGLAGHRGIRTVRLDVTDPESVAQAAEQIARDAPGGLHAVVNNAGVIVQGPLELLPAQELRRQFEVNVYGPHQVTAAFLPLLRAGGGRVVNISAPSARTALPFFGPISASKAALESLSVALRGELAEWAVPVTVVELGMMDTPIFAKADQAAKAVMARASADQMDLYASPLASLAKASARMTPAPVDGAVKGIVEAVEASRPKHRYLVGRDTRMASLLVVLPSRARGRVLARVLGLKAPR
ncbi:MAG: SDR family NAD(P)-dependent oxidoreductase [Actinocrinis sp.]